MRVLGIDNGLDGGLVEVSDVGLVKLVMPAITIKASKREYNIPALAAWIKLWKPDHAFLEKAQAMPGQGVSSMFSIGNGYGIMRGLLTGLGIPHTLVHPKTWQKVMFQDLPKSDTKAMSTVIAGRLWPSEDWRATPKCKKAHDGLTDAACIAEYGRRVLTGLAHNG
jgi:crossover junction endodeoxyribonuclease RuvC